MTAHRTGFVDVGGEPLYYEVSGDGFPLVLCHGAGGNHVSWYQQVAAFASDHAVVTWDHRGFGRSRATSGAGDPKVSVGDLIAVFDALGVERAHLVAQSMGGWAALGLTIAQPDRVATLTLADTVAGITSPVIEANWRDSMARLRERAASGALGDVPALGRRFVRDDPAGAVLYQAIGSLNNELSPDLLRGLLATTWPSEALATLAVPTLFVVGEDDDIFPPAVIHDAAIAIAGASVEVIPGAGHSPYFETPAAWNDILRAFLDTAAR